MIQTKNDDLICGFLKVRNEMIRENNIVRCLHNMSEFCSDIYAVDDASYDGTREYLLSQLPADHVILIDPEEQDFAKELEVKQRLIDLIHANGPWKFIYWADADEVLDAEGTANIRDFCRANLQTNMQAWAMHYQQLWVKSRWARTDSEFDDGWFVKLWRYHPELSFEIIPGTHNRQFPVQFDEAFRRGLVERSKWEVLHYGNYGTNLRHKCIQYYGGLGGVDRHLLHNGATYREIPITKFPSGAEYDLDAGDPPTGYSTEHIELIRGLKNLKNLEETFCVTISTYNRGDTLPRAIQSVLNQTYPKFIVVVIDDGSTDNTKEVMREWQDRDPRVFYIQCLQNRGGVAVNEIACDIAINTCEYWVRLGSDDWMAPNKLGADFEVFKMGHKAIYGPFQAHDHVTRQLQEIGNTPYPKDKQQDCFEQSGFIASWADFAVHTSILKKIKAKHGMYVHPQLINMEDCLLNYRICKITPWVWRGVFDHTWVVDPDETTMHKIVAERDKLTPTAFWNKNPVGASANHQIYAKDRALTTQLILAEKGVSY